MRQYQKPVFRKVQGLGFILAHIKQKWAQACRQCSSCHGCR